MERFIPIIALVFMGACVYFAVDILMFVVTYWLWIVAAWLVFGLGSIIFGYDINLPKSTSESTLTSTSSALEPDPTVVNFTVHRKNPWKSGEEVEHIQVRKHY